MLVAVRPLQGIHEICQQSTLMALQAKNKGEKAFFGSADGRAGRDTHVGCWQQKGRWCVVTGEDFYPP